MKCNYHTHCNYCDGKEEMVRFVDKAAELGFDHLGFSSHAPIGFRNEFSIQEEQIPAYLAEIESYKTKYKNLTLYSALECDFVPGVSTEFEKFSNSYKFDYLIGGVHLVGNSSMPKLWFIDGGDPKVYDYGLMNYFAGDVRKAVTFFWEQTFEMIETQKFEIVAHLDKIKMHNHDRYFKEDEKWYRDLAFHAVELIKRKGLIVEINSRGLYRGRCDSFYPADFLLREVAKYDIPCIISSDAHRAEELPLYYDEAKRHLKEAGVRALVALVNGQWVEDEQL
ncbi:MAG: histidinol-phosphatase [Bacteroidales bacterium]|nr:histidinol-phosphatase [Bacteroidales bacterium]